MAKAKSIYICTACGAESPKWMGCCPSCGEWNTMEEEIRTASAPGKPDGRGKFAARKLLEIPPDDAVRYATGMKELDRVLGGGLVKGSVVLLSGEPGIGKSTLLLQITQTLGESLPILYISGEESPHQLKLRANRLGVTTENLSILCETDVAGLTDYLKTERPGFVVVDSIQTMQTAEVTSSPGSVAQVRESTNHLLRAAKELNIPMLLVGHVNKDGAIAGPKVLEHIVDAVLYFEGERNLSYRILRAVKNRFGSTNEIGVFEMGGMGLREVENPSAAMLAGRPLGVSGSCVACVMEGTRPILAEVQALVSAAGYGTAVRQSQGFDGWRLRMLLAVLEKRAGYFFTGMDTYVNVVGGLKLDEPSADLSVAMALVSGLKDKPLPDDCLIFGEIGLGGEIRAVSHCPQRVREAARLGFSKVILPKANLAKLPKAAMEGTKVLGVSYIREVWSAVEK
ncbi:MAG: DNA repair protein RadA [Oscillospiraceae bacterium]|jgi:DNA repair protein RadA/Sms|nr:DNA repair protein RadA [Oscillospiraceae bacterium]